MMKMLALGILLCSTQLALAADHAAALKDYLTDDVVAVAYLNLASIDTLGVVEWGEQLGAVSAEQRGAVVKVATAAQSQLDKLADSGVSHLYLLFRVSDVVHGGPSWVVPIAEGGDAKDVLGMIGMVRLGMAAAKSAELPEFWDATEDAVLGGTTAEQLEQLKTTRPSQPRDLNDAWATLGQGTLGLVIFGDRDSRRVVREMFPPLPEPFAELTGELVADGLQWGGVSVTLPPQADVEIVVEAQDETSAAAVAKLMATGLDLIKQLPTDKDFLTAADQKLLVDSFSPEVEGLRVRIQLDEVVGDVKRLARLVNPPIRSARQAAQRTTRMNKFKHIGLAFHYYADKNKETFPTQASYDDQGKPLLSWRVHLLPHLDQKELYAQFHLDEPWDSEHNRKLIEKMPEIYADPDSSLRKINAAGKTTFVVPAGAGTLFEGREGKQFKDIIDGTSNTILALEVVPERAVVWTQPKDWEVDFGDPLDGVRRSDREWFNAARCDGNAYSFTNSIDEDRLRGLLTIAGKENIPYP